MRAKKPRSKRQKLKDRYAAMQDLRPRLAGTGNGYHIFRLSRAHRKYAKDFVAVLKDRPDQFLLVLGCEHGYAKIRPFFDKSQYPPVQKALDDARKKAGIYVQWDRQIGLSLKERAHLALKCFLTPEGQDEYERLTGKAL